MRGSRRGSWDGDSEDEDQQVNGGGGRGGGAPTSVPAGMAKSSSGVLKGAAAQLEGEFSRKGGKSSRVYAYPRVREGMPTPE